MKKRLLLGASCAAIFSISFGALALGAVPATRSNNPIPPKVQTASVAEDSTTADPCVNVANAKFAQWNQQRFMIHRTETFSDGSKKEIEAIFMEDVAYGHEVGLPWETENLVRKERALPPPDVLVKRMGLAECQLAGTARDIKQPASLFTYGYIPDSKASHVTGKMWISDSSDLPVRQELSQEAETNHKVPVAMSATFAYGDDVQVPKGAVQSNNLRRWLQQQGLLTNTLIVAGPGPTLAGSPNHR
ncbi:MAG TPA: hypothetical protein VHY79_07870 [Rhizomicrobium sp.]|nr:hypothetical protein [Rhizomicrobium sp.]